jgi:RNA polymerase sigma-70 factor, ECF subfamily
VTGPVDDKELARRDAARLIARIAGEGDRAAFSALFTSFAPIVKGMLMRQGADAATADDIAQETLLTVWRKAALYAPERGGAATWIYTIARNLRIDRLRREVPWQELTEERMEEPSDEPLQDDALNSKQIQGRMRDVLSGLPVDQVDVVKLAYLDGLSHSEIAERLNVPLGTVKSRMRLAYQKIKDAFEASAV